VHECVFKICSREAWFEAGRTGVLAPSAADHRDGYVHLSTREQLAETARRHFAGMRDLLVLEVAVDRVREQLRWEPARDGQLFPHLYGALRSSYVQKSYDMPSAEHGWAEFLDHVASDAPLEG
jgi:uncharacterized protein (DUF952 family)